MLLKKPHCRFRFKCKTLSIKVLILSLFLSSATVPLASAHENISIHNEFIIDEPLRSFQNQAISPTFCFSSGVIIEGILTAQQIAISIASTYLASHLKGGQSLRQTAKYLSYIGLITNIFDGVAAAQELWSGTGNENAYFSGFSMGHSLTKAFLKNPITLLTDALIENIFPLLNRNTLFSTGLSVYEWSSGKSLSLAEKAASLDHFEKGSTHYNQLYRIVGGIISGTTLIYITKPHLFDSTNQASPPSKTQPNEIAIKDAIKERPRPTRTIQLTREIYQSETSGSSENSKASIPHSLRAISPERETDIVHKKIRIKTKGTPFIIAPEETKNTNVFAAQKPSPLATAATSTPVQSTRLLFLKKSDDQALENLLTLAPRSNYHQHLPFSKLDSFLRKLGAETSPTKGSKFSIRLDGVVIGGSEKGHGYSGASIVKNYDGVHTALKAIAQRDHEFRDLLESKVSQLDRKNFWQENDSPKKK